MPCSQLCSPMIPTFFITGTKCEQIETLINTELELVAQWLRSNLLSLNLLKTAYMVFTKQKVRHMNLLLQSSIISQVSETKFLGVIINEELSWSPHLIQVCNKISKNVGVIAKARHLLPQDDVCLLYHSLVEPYLNYCCMVWASDEKSRILDKILKIPKKYCRLITFSHFQAQSGPLFIS